MTTAKRLSIYLRSRRHLLLLRLFPRLRSHEALLHSLDLQKQNNNRYLAEIAILKGQVAEARESAQTSAISARQALDRSTQITLANEQLQEQLTATMREMADRIERAYGGTFNWAAQGGFASRRTPYPWLPTSEPPAITTPNLSAPMGRTNLRHMAAKQSEEFLRSLKVSDPLMARATTEAFERLQRQGPTATEPEAQAK